MARRISVFLLACGLTGSSYSTCGINELVYRICIPSEFRLFGSGYFPGGERPIQFRRVFYAGGLIMFFSRAQCSLGTRPHGSIVNPAIDILDFFSC